MVRRYPIVMATQLPRNKTRPDEMCEACAKQPAERVLFRNGDVQVDTSGRVVARTENRVAVCESCWRDINDDRRGLPRGRVTHRLNRGTDKLEPV